MVTQRHHFQTYATLDNHPKMFSEENNIEFLQIMRSKYMYRNRELIAQDFTMCFRFHSPKVSRIA